MDSCSHSNEYLHNGYMPYGFDLDVRVMLQLLDKQFHKVRDYSADTLLVGKQPVDLQLQFPTRYIWINQKRYPFSYGRQQKYLHLSSNGRFVTSAYHGSYESQFYQLQARCFQHDKL